MFNLFKKKQVTTTNELKVEVMDQPKRKSYPKEVEAIHNEFFTAGDKLLEEANEILKKCSEKDINKGKRLISLGFTETIHAQQYKSSEITKETADRIKYYQRAYPNNKFITRSQVNTICTKYNLVIGDISAYKGFVPDSKISLIEKFSVKKSDIEIIRFSQSTYPDKNGRMMQDNGEFAQKYSSIYKKVDVESKFKICAPLKDMNVYWHQQVVGNEIVEIPDPIVLQPVKDGYLIVAAWGDEASDEIVVNQNHN